MERNLLDMNDNENDFKDVLNIVGKKMFYIKDNVKEEAVL